MEKAFETLNKATERIEKTWKPSINPSRRYNVTD